jgi:hexulose-6-phosphate isomerase
MLGKHLFGLYEKALNPNDDWVARLETIKALGFDFVEICIDEQDHRIERLHWSRQQVEDLRRTVSAAQFPILSMCLSAHRRFPFGSADSEKRRIAYELMGRAIAFSVAMGIRVIQIAGYDVYYEPSTEESRARFLDGLAWAVREAARYQVMLGMEVMDTELLSSITKYLNYWEQIPSPWLRVYPDLGNLSAWGNDVPMELEKGIAHMVGIHLKDTLPVTAHSAGQFKGVPFGTGCVDFSSSFAWLEQLGYAGPYLLETWYAEGQEDVQTVAAAKAFLENQFASASLGDAASA